MEFLGQTTQPDGSELTAKLVSLFSISLLSLLFGIKTFNVHFRYLTYSRWLVLILYICSWSFTVTSMLLVTTNNRNFISCFLSIMACAIFYSGTKICIYAWLIEKIYVVSSLRTTRWKSKVYKFHVSLLLPYIVIFILMLIFHVAEIDSTGICIIGLQSIASLSLLIYDFILNLYMTIFFVKPLLKLGSGLKMDWKASRLNEVALRTLVASVVCLIASFTNVLALVILHGRERGLVCLTCCTVDVTINVITIHWVTSPTPGKKIKEDNMDYSQNQRDSNPELSSHFKSYNLKNDPNAIFHDNQSDIDAMVTHANEYDFTNNNFQIGDNKSASPYTMDANVSTNKPTFAKAPIDEKMDDEEASAESNFCSSSVHESHSSRRSLTKK